MLIEKRLNGPQAPSALLPAPNWSLILPGPGGGGDDDELYLGGIEADGYGSSVVADRMPPGAKAGGGGVGLPSACGDASTW